jgi:hypothetical protein
MFMPRLDACVRSIFCPEVAGSGDKRRLLRNVV